MEKSPVHEKQHRAGKLSNGAENERKIWFKVNAFRARQMVTHQDVVKRERTCKRQDFAGLCVYREAVQLDLQVECFLADTQCVCRLRTAVVVQLQHLLDVHLLDVLQ